MVFYSARELRTIPKEIWETLEGGEEAIITNNGKPAALMLDISGRDPEVCLRAVRQAKAMLAFNSMREKAGMAGYMSESEIEREIADSRLERKSAG
ncbi:MAG: prevent-host-death protein [Clostridiales bacterium]|nr:prevent-host-death protein [Clostridiales bacterium]